MSPFLFAGLVTLLMLALLFLRVPVAYSLLIAGVVGLVGLRTLDFSLTASAAQMFDSTASWSLVVIPLFVAMGVFARHGTLATDAFDLARRALYRVPGGLAMATVLAAAGFAALNGSSVATVAAIGPISIREMRKAGYSASFAAGIVGSSGTLGVLIPPSIFLVLYGIVAGESIGKILIAGIIPGILTAMVFILAIFLRARFAPASILEKVAAASPEVKAAIFEQQGAHRGDGVARVAQPIAVADRPAHEPVVLGSLDQDATPPRTGDYVATVVKGASLVIVVVGGIYAGVLTAVEAAAFGMLLTIIYFVIDQKTRYQRRSARRIWSSFRGAVREIVELNAMMFALIVGATVFTFFLILAQVPQSLATAILDMDINATLVVIMFLVLLIPMGMFLDSISILLVAVPLMYPVITELGFDGIWFGILVVKMIELGLITPPVGLNAFVTSGVSKIPVAHVFKGLLWFIPLDFLLVAIFFAFPSIVTWLPGLMG